ncbi:MAG: hypothetical protein IPI46_10750 [Bacteroidetes bacterium]|nr:hypothetical protein [Bacteroidota bacterium]
MLSLFRNITFFITLLFLSTKVTDAKSIRVVYLDDTIQTEINENVWIDFHGALSDNSIQLFYETFRSSGSAALIDKLLEYKKSHQLNDWLYYQLIRKTAEQMSPKANNYNRYTLYKWALLSLSGYDATVSFGKRTLLLYVRSEDNIYGIPYFERDGHQYICLNYHDFGKINFNRDLVHETSLRVASANRSFSYKITMLPDFKPSDYVSKDLQFDFRNKAYHFVVKLNPEIKTLFTNYPVSDFGNYFNIPLSKETYSSLIPELKSQTNSLNEQDRVDFLMRFTRYSFLYETDQNNFGKEKRLSPEQTLLYEYSDCDDRAALFFYLVKEICDLPMIVLLYPTHVTIAVQFSEPVGNAIVYKGNSYSICEPTPQQEDTEIGQIAKHLKSSKYEVVYEYSPLNKK